jgi:FHS family glucose/mannose:H+ symporter-like MFS transporter
MADNGESTTERRLNIAARLGFFVIGIITVLLGLVLPILSARLSLDDAQAGTLFIAQFSGSITGTLFSGRLIKRFGFDGTLLAGLVLLMLGIPGLNLWSLPACLVSVFVYGAGLGVSIPATNLLAIEVAPITRRTAAANFINFCWGLGAIASQPFVALFATGDSLLTATLVLDAMLLVVAALVFSSRRAASPQSVPPDSPEPASRIWNKPIAWLIAAFNFLNIGVESGLGGWLTTYSDRLQSEGRMWFNATILFFAFLVIGRGLASVISRWVTENQLLIGCTITLMFGVGLILVTNNPVTPLAGAVVAGLGTSAIFPTNVVRFTNLFGPSATRQATPLFVTGTVGAAVLSSLVGFVSTRSGSLQTGLLVLAASAALLLTIQVLFSSTRRKHDRSFADF